jgi:hypothetical protein
VAFEISSIGRRKFTQPQHLQKNSTLIEMDEFLASKPEVAKHWNEQLVVMSRWLKIHDVIANLNA